jgi:hypothetical protein
MSEYFQASVLQSRAQPLAIAIATDLMVACSDSETVTEYSVQKVNAKDNYGHEWLPLNPTTYRIGNNTVVSETAGILHKYKNCIVMSTDNWECQYDDGSGSFGVRNGEFWRTPEWPDIRVVSRLEYNRIRYEWALEDKYEGKFWGAVDCVIGWE